MFISILLLVLLLGMEILISSPYTIAAFVHVSTSYERRSLQPPGYINHWYHHVKTNPTIRRISTTTSSSTHVPTILLQRGTMMILYDQMKRWNDSFDMDELQERIRDVQSRQNNNNIKQISDPYLYHHQRPTSSYESIQPNHDDTISSSPQPVLNTVYIVSFPKQSDPTTNSTHTIHGIHSIEYPIQSGKNIILAFTNEESCSKFASTLQQQQFFHPMVQAISVEAIVEICCNMGVTIQLIPDGIDVIPPKYNVEQLGLPSSSSNQKEMKNNHHHNHGTMNKSSYYMDITTMEQEQDEDALRLLQQQRQNLNSIYYNHQYDDENTYDIDDTIIGGGGGGGVLE